MTNPNNSSSLSSSVSSSREGETPQQLEEKKDAGLLGSAGGGSIGDWKPIDTAPKDDPFFQYLLTYCPEGYALLYWSGHRWDDGSGDSYQDYHPTHWMMLPEPPTLQAQNPARDSQAAEPSNVQSSAFSDQGETPAAPVEPSERNAKLTYAIHRLLDESANIPEHTVWTACPNRELAERILALVWGISTAPRWREDRVNEQGIR
jgi:hypothetical protein